MEDPQVRQKAVECLIDLISDKSSGKLSENNKLLGFYADHVLGMVKQLAQWDHYNSRISACSLVAQTYDHLSDDLKEELSEVFVTLCGDDTPMVRRAAALNLPNFLNIAKQTHQMKLVELWFKLIQDSFDSVRIASVEASHQILDFLEKSSIETVVASFEGQTHLSWRVKYSMCEVLPLLLQKSTEKNQVLMIFKKLLQDYDMEVKSIAISKIPDIA
jgi:serine/threonine-protein phosphatase 2A regulatory subunit A